MVRFEVADVVEALARLGLTREPLIEAVLVGEASRDGCTANDPFNAPGFFAWAHTVRALRELLIPHGWSVSESNGLSIVVSPDDRIAIAVSSGDEITGKVLGNREPKTKYPKGPATIAAVEVNRQLQLFESNNEALSQVDTPRTETWLLLRNRTEEAVSIELSLPFSVAEDLQVHGWSERIVLGETLLTPDPDTLGEHDEGDEIDVRVVRRAS